MGSFYDTIKILNGSESKKQESLKRFLETVTNTISDRVIGEKDPEGALTEHCTLEVMEASAGWGSSTLSFVDKSGKLHRCIVEVNKKDDKASDTETEPNYPSAVFTISGKLVHLFGALS